MKRRALFKAGAGTLLLASQATLSSSRASEKSGTDSRRDELYGLLGQLPPRNRPVSAQPLSSEDRGAYTSSTRS